MPDRPASPFELRFQLGPFPVAIEPSFWLMSAVMASGERRLDRIVAWIALVFVSILVHELGHAVAMRSFGAAAVIRLHSLGGLAIPDRVFPRGKDVVVSLAGPFAGFLLYGLVLLLEWRFPPPSGFGQWVFHQAKFLNLWWGLVNLLPVLPLDGGHVLAGVLGAKRIRTVALVGGIVASAAVAYGLRHQDVYVAVLFGWLAIRNLMLYSEIGKRTEPARSYVPRRQEAGTSLQAGWDALAKGEEREAARLGLLALDEATAADARNRARDLLAWVALADGEPRAALNHLDGTEPAEAARPLTVAMTLEALGEPERARAHALRAMQTEPSDTSAATAARVLIQTGELPDAERLCRAHAWGNGATRDSLLAEIAFLRLDFAAAAALAEAAFVSGKRPSDAYNVACAAARSGDVHRAAAWLKRALDAGYDDFEGLAADEDLAAVRAEPEIAALVAPRA